MVTDDPARSGPASGDPPVPPASKITPDSLEEFRRQLFTGSEETVNPKTWSSSLPNQWGTVPILRGGMVQMVQPALAAARVSARGLRLLRRRSQRKERLCLLRLVLLLLLLLCGG